MHKHVFLLALLGAVAAGSAAMGAGYQLEKTHVDVLFAVSHLGFTQKHGSFRDLDAKLDCDPEKLEACKVEVVIRAASIDTGHEGRDKDLKSDRFFDVVKYPEIRFVSRKVSRARDNGVRVEGELTLHGVTKPLTLEGTLNKIGPNPFDNKPTLGFSVHGALKRSDFGVAALIPRIGDDVTITIDAEFNHAI
jgi:polyisoprenoid-binding protein YceI